MVNVHTIPTEKMDAYNEGYHAGYNRKAPDNAKWTTRIYADVYYRAHITGLEDRYEDKSAIELGEFDLLNEDERLEIYGDERP